MKPLQLTLAIALLAPFAAGQGPVDASLNLPTLPGAGPGWSATPPGAYQAQHSDDFNRPDAPDLGPNWINQSGSFAINTNRGQSTGSGPGQWTRHAQASVNYANAKQTLDLLPGPTSRFGALIFCAGGGATLNLKIQDNNGDGTLDTFGFYQNNSGPWSGGTGFGFLATPVLQCRLTAYFTANGDVAHMDVDHNFDGIPEEQLTSGNLLSSGLNLTGTGLGIGCWNTMVFDNWTGGDGQAPTIVYCTAKVNSLGCSPTIGSTGTPSSVNTSGFVVSASQVRNQKSGLLFYGFTGQNSAPFQGGTLCVKAPIKRTPAVTSGGSTLPTNDCTGVYSIDMNSFAHGLLGGTPSPLLVNPGQVVNCQFWGRDPGFPAPNNTTLSDGLEYTVQ